MAYLEPGFVAQPLLFAQAPAGAVRRTTVGKHRVGQNLYPKAPDMTLAETQDLSDGELFDILENEVRWTGMPA